MYKSLVSTNVLIYKKCELSRFIILGFSGLDSHFIQIYAESPHSWCEHSLYLGIKFFQVVEK